MSGPMGGTPDKGFQDRLARMQERRAPIEAARPQVDVLPDWKANVRYPASLVGLVFLGMFAVFFVRYARFHLMGDTLAGESADFTMIVDAGLAGLASLLIFGAIGLTARDSSRAEHQSLFSLQGLGDHPMKLALVVGIATMIGTMHNMVYKAPGLFSVIFSQEWTEDVIAYSAPGSIYYRGDFYVLFPEEETVAEEETVPAEVIEVPAEPAEKVLPKVRRL